MILPNIFHKPVQLGKTLCLHDQEKVVFSEYMI